MVGASNLVVDVGRLEVGAEGGADEEVVDAPTDVIFAGASPMAPPGVALFVGMEDTEGVDKALVNEVGNSLAFGGGEAGTSGVGLGASEVNGGVGGIEVAADDDGFGLFEAFEVLEKGRIPELFAERETGEVRFAVGGVNGDEVEFGVFGGEDAAFVEGIAVGVGEVGGVELVAPDSFDPYWGGLGEDGGAGIAAALGGVPVFGVVGEVESSLAGLSLGFLETENVGAEVGDEGLEGIFAEDGAEAVDIPGKNTVSVLVGRGGH